MKQNLKLIKLLDAEVHTLVLYDDEHKLPIAQICSDGQITFLKTEIYKPLIVQVMELSNNFHVIYNSL